MSSSSHQVKEHEGQKKDEDRRGKDEPRAGTTSTGQDIINLQTISSYHINGKTDNIINTGNRGSNDFLKQDWEIRMLENGFLRMRFSGGQQFSDDFFDLDLIEGDIIRTSGSVLQVVHFKAKTAVAPDYTTFALMSNASV